MIDFGKFDFNSAHVVKLASIMVEIIQEAANSDSTMDPRTITLSFMLCAGRAGKKVAFTRVELHKMLDVAMDVSNNDQVH